MKQSFPGMSFLKRGNLELRHREHRVPQHPFSFFRVRVLHKVTQYRRNDLPRDAETVLKLTALFCFSAVGQFFPENIDLFLSPAPHEERDRGGERELRASVQRDELLSFEAEGRVVHPF